MVNQIMPNIPDFPVY